MYLPLTWLSMQDSLQEMDRLRVEDLSRKLYTTKAVVESFLKDDRVLEACQRLNAEYEARNIATFTLLSEEASCYQPEAMKVLPPIPVRGEARIFLINQIPLSFILEKTKNVDWAISVLTPTKINFFKRLQESSIIRNAVLKDFLIVVYIIFSFVLLGVLVLAKSIQNQYRKLGKDPFWLKAINIIFGRLQLHDLKVLKAATSVLIKKNDSLLKDQDLLETSLEFSILNEIKSHQHQIPYSFFGTVAKVDINGFSKMVSAGQTDISNSLTTYLEEFGCELLLRYEGLFEKTVGDEIVVVFRGEKSELLALSFARDLMGEFSAIKFKVGQEERSFTLKSSIYSSELTFLKRASGYGFLGDALTYTTRLLSVVDRKDINVLSCLKSQSASLKALSIIPEQSKLFDFKNMQSMDGYLVDHFLTIDEVFQSNIENIKFFRSDKSLQYLLEKISIEDNIQNINIILGVFAGLQCRRSTNEVQILWMSVIKNIEQKALVRGEFSPVLSALIMDGARLIPKPEWTSELTMCLLNLNRKISGRINASIVEVLMEKDLSSLLTNQAKEFVLEGDDSYRTQGNLLVLQAVQSLSAKTLAAVTHMIQSNQKNESLTGVYSACQILNYYLAKNPAALETYGEYKKLVGILRTVFNERSASLTVRLMESLRKTINLIEASRASDL